MNNAQSITDNTAPFDSNPLDETITQPKGSPIQQPTQTLQEHDNVTLGAHAVQKISAPTKKLRKRDIALI